jgi:hypothetical protein
MAWRRRRRLVLERSARRLLHRALVAAFFGWQQAAAGKRGARESSTAEGLQGQLRQAEVRGRGQHRPVTCCAALDGAVGGEAPALWGRCLSARPGAVAPNRRQRPTRPQTENERLRRDNERFVRLIDSGEWGRGRVAELVAAGGVLQGERDALLQLIRSLRREYEGVQVGGAGPPWAHVHPRSHGHWTSSP